MLPRDFASQSGAFGLLIVAHGTRDERGRAEFGQLVTEVESLVPGQIVEGCYLELAEPDIAAGIERMHHGGVSQLTVVPLLLVAAGHAKRDIPRQIARAASSFPDLSVCLAPHLGCREPILRLSVQRFREAILDRASVAVEDTMLVFVGRGTNDATANEELRQFARLREGRTPVGRLATCFLAMAEPSLAEALELAESLDFRRVVVQPHLLFQGELMDRVREMVSRAAANDRSKEFLVCDRLGPATLIAQAVIEAAAAAPNCQSVVDVDLSGK
ncbi:MAG: sirohydrochlorin chelatase [Planctomycetia bacterium]|nr:sirohydrochlorin chelatase [Planctomycetia bacterium]